MKSNLYKVFSAVLVLMFITLACGASGPDGSVTPVNKLKVFADYQIKTAFADTGIIKYCSKETGIDVTVDYGSSTTLRVLNTQKAPYDAFWATSSIFLVNGGSPVYTAKSVIGIGTYDSVIARLGWDPKNLHLQQVLDAAAARQINWTMVNPSQGDPSSSFLIASYTKMVGETMLTQEGLSRLPIDYLKASFGSLLQASDNIDVLSEEILKDRTSGANQFDTYVLYEATVIQLNRELVKAGLEPIKFMYIRDASTAGKFPITFTGGDETRAAYGTFTNCLLGEFAVKTLSGNGYRTTQFGMSQPDADLSVFNPDWGIEATGADLRLIDFPLPDVTLSALDTFQTSLKPWQRSAMCFDVSTSMQGDGEKQLDQAATLIFDQGNALINGLSIGPNDAYTVFSFSEDVRLLGTVYGYDKNAVTAMSSTVVNESLRGGTAMNDCIREALLYLIKQPFVTLPDPNNPNNLVEVHSMYYDQSYPDYDPANYIYTIYVMTDGDTNSGWDINNITWFYEKLPENYRIRIVGVGFGGVDDREKGPYRTIVTKSGGLYFDGRQNLVETLKRALSNY